MGKIPVPKSGYEPATFMESLHSPLISEELFYQVQQILKGKRPPKASIKKQNDELYLHGILLCGKCHSHLTGSASRSSKGKGIIITIAIIVKNFDIRLMMLMFKWICFFND